MNNYTVMWSDYVTKQIRPSHATARNGCIYLSNAEIMCHVTHDSLGFPHNFVAIYYTRCTLLRCPYTFKYFNDHSTLPQTM